MHDCLVVSTYQMFKVLLCDINISSQQTSSFVFELVKKIR